MIYLLIFVCLSLVIWVIGLRSFYFARKPKFYESFCKNIIYSPAQGSVVYIKKRQTKKDICICKSDQFNGKRLFKIEEYLKDYKYSQIGIFMTQYDTHYVINQINDQIKQIVCLGDNNQSVMLSCIDNILSVFGIRFLNWIQKSQKYIHYNQQYLIEYNNGIMLVLTMDKYVNKFDYQVKKVYDPYVLGFVHRGSQTDVFIPQYLVEDIFVEQGMKISYKDKIAELKDEE